MPADRMTVPTARTSDYVFLGAGALIGVVQVALMQSGALGMISVFFYRGLVALVLAAVASFLLLAYARRRWLRGVRVETVFAAVVAMAAVHLVFFVVVPVTLDRSVSVFLLRTLAQRPSEPLSRERLRDALVNQYVDARGAVERRMAEQLISGNVEQRSDGFVLSERGGWFLRFGDLVAFWYGVDAKEGECLAKVGGHETTCPANSY